MVAAEPQGRATAQWRAPAGTIHVVDPSPLNWLFITWNTMEEPIRVDEDGRIAFALATGAQWLDNHTLALTLRQGVRFQDGEPFTAHNIKQNFDDEKKIVPAWDVMLHGWFDLSSEAPPAAVHREFFGADGAFRAGPELPEFDRLYAEMAAQIDGATLVAVAERIDKLVYDEALALFLCAPETLYAVNKHVSFLGYRTTFELAETAVDEEHWSRHSAAHGSPDQAAALC